MPLELVLAGLAVIAVVLAVLPAGRRLVATAVDIVDASVAMYAVRRTLGLDTTTGRQRRIAERNAREQAEILRRIGGSPPLPTPSPSAAGTAVAPAAAASPAVTPTAVTPTAVGTPRPTRALDGAAIRERHLRDALVATVALAVVIVTVSIVFSQPSGGVLGVTGQPSVPPEPSAAGVAGASSGSVAASGAVEPGTSATVGPAGPAESAASGSAAAGSAAPASSGAPAAGASTVIEDPTARLAGTTAGGGSVRIALAWTIAAGSHPPARFLLERRVADGPYETIARLPGAARSAAATAPVGDTTTFRLTPLGVTGTAGAAVAWRPVSPALRQESSVAVSLVGGWRTATGPSLSGGRVAYSRAGDARASFRWTGTDVGWVATRTPMSGKAEVRLDGAFVATIDLGSPDVRYRQLVFRRRVPAGAHVLEIRTAGGGRIDVDAFVALR